MAPTKAISSGFRNYATFSGRATKSQFWTFFFFVIGGHLVCQVLDAIIFGGGTARIDTSLRFPLSALFTAVTFVPFLAVAWRRRHDTGEKGWPVLLPFALMTLAAGLFFLAFAGPGGSPETGATDPEFISTGIGISGALFGAVVIILAVAVGLFIIWLAADGDGGSNAYGPPPREEP